MKQNVASSIHSNETIVSLKMIESINDYGTVKICENVITSVVKRAACKVNGVTRLTSKSFLGSIARIFGGSNIPDSVVQFNITGNDIKIYLKVNIAYGYNIQDIAIKVQNTVSDEVKLITGMNVSKVNVEIQEIDLPVIE